MTEQEWLSSSQPGRMLDWFYRKALDGAGSRKEAGCSDRKLRLLSVAIERAWWGAEADPKVLSSFRVAEAWADGLLASDSCEVCRFAGIGWWMRSDALEAAEESIRAHDVAADQPIWAALIRDVFNPFRPVTLPLEVPWGARFNSGTTTHSDARCPWLTPTVLSLADEAYAGDWSALLPLADALEEAGCESPACDTCDGRRTLYRSPSGDLCREATIWGYDPVPCFKCGGEGRLPHPLLAHLRSPGPHARGCWAVDLVLGQG